MFASGGTFNDVGYQKGSKNDNLQPLLYGGKTGDQRAKPFSVRLGPVASHSG